MISEDLESCFGTMEVVTLPGLVGLMASSGVITFGVELAGRTTSLAAWVSPALRSRIIVGSGRLEDLGFSAVKEIPRWIGSDRPIQETRTLGVPGFSFAVARLTKRQEDPLSLGRFGGQSARKESDVIISHGMGMRSHVTQ